MTTFRTTVRLGGKTATGLPVPADVVEALGAGRQPQVRVTVNGHAYGSRIAVRGSEFLIPLSAEHRAAAGVAAGDEVEVALDTAPRELEVPADLAAALAAAPEAKAFFDSISYSRKRRFVLGVEGAKTEATRER